ncbi:hypothetical protein B0H19DRAFT_1144901 [Mycena capillaripes]|nr:hypothetical protein B0H19DRAFT_1144901 [Mycena capillaripes]
MDHRAMKMLLDLPAELQDIIISLLDTKEDLWVLVQVSRTLRRLVQIPLLSRYNIPASQIFSGSVTLSGEACFLVPMIYHIHPILKLSIVLGPSSLEGHGAVHVSRHQHFSPIFILLPPSVLKSGIGCCLCHVFFLFLISSILVFLIQNFILSLTWVYYRIVGQDLDNTFRIAADLGSVTRHANSLRFTLTTFPPINRITVNHLPALFPAQSAALIAALDLEDHLEVVAIAPDSALSLHVLVKFIHRHQLLAVLILERGAIDSASLAEEPSLDVYGAITTLSCPAGYIPYILPTQRSVTALTITSAANCLELAHALSIIASSPDSRVKMLTLRFTRRRFVRQILPWRANSDPEANPPLRSVRHIATFSHFKYGKADARGIPLWLARFPAMVSVRLSAASVPLSERAALVKAILERRLSGEWEEVYFNT